MENDSALLARNTVWASLASLSQFGTAAIVLVLLTHEYAPAVFGHYVGVLGLVFFVSPFAGLGAPSLLHKRHGAEGVPLPRAYAVATGSTLVGGLAWTLAITAASFVVLPEVDQRMVAALAAAELLFIAQVDAGQAVVQATETLAMAVVLKLGQAGLRLAALVALLVTTSTPSITQWSMLYLAAAMGAAALSHVLVSRHIEGMERVPLPSRRDVREGVELTLGWGTDRLRTDADKVLLVRYGFGADAGLYGAVSRILQLAYVPIRGAVAASLARFWRGANTPGSPALLARRLTAVAGVYGVLVGALLAGAAPFVPAVLGDGYEGATEILYWLTPMPFLLAMQAFPATALTSEGYNSERIVVIVTGVVVNIVLNIAFIPAHGWRGAVGSTLVTELLLIGSLWAVLWQRTTTNRGTPEKWEAGRA